jgi:hypothetical protein
MWRFIIKNEELAKRYFKNWESRKSVSQSFKGQADAILVDKSVVTANAAFGS